MKIIQYNRVGGKYKFQLETYGTYELPPDLARRAKALKWNVKVPFYTVSPKTASAQAGYAWNGASGPVPDTHRTLRATLIHDVLYQAIREGQISRVSRLLADDVMDAILKEDGMWRVTRMFWYIAVRTFGYFAVRKRS